jgi:Flp pilus assembly pilin Flp
MKIVMQWVRNCQGATAIEYGLLLAGVALAILVAVTAFGDNLYSFFYERLPGALGE